MEQKIITVRLNEDQVKALEQFIGRVNLNAKEVAAFNDLMAAFGSAAQEAHQVVDTTNMEMPPQPNFGSPEKEEVKD